MLLWKNYDIADNERALLYKRDRLVKVLRPGRHRVWRSQGTRIEKYDITQDRFEHVRAKFLLTNYADQFASEIESVELGDNEVGLVYRDNKLNSVLAPGSFWAAWKDFGELKVERIDIEKHFEVDASLMGILRFGQHAAASRLKAPAMVYSEVPDEHVGLLMINGKLDRILSAGVYGFWNYNRSISVKLLDLRLQVMEVSGQEILTKDRVSLRINLSASYKIRDVETVALKLKDFAGFVYQELQLRLREAVGTKTLDQLLEDKDALNAVIADGAKARLDEYGIVMPSVGVKDLILPGDMKLILNQVVQAQKESEANLIKRREETQAVRALHNTAKLMDDNPVLLRLKELEALERITERISNINVYGGLDSVMTDLVKLAPRA
jgi:hypothetical protein